VSAITIVQSTPSSGGIGWLPTVLALEVALSGWRPKVRGDSPADRDMSLANQLWVPHASMVNCLKLGIEVAQSTVAKYIGEEWRGGHRPEDLSAQHAGRHRRDGLLIVRRSASATFRSGHPQASTAATDITVGDGQSNGGMDATRITEAFPWDETPDHLIRDRDASYGPRSRSVLRPWAYRSPNGSTSPWQNGHAERLIGSMPRECLDHIVVFR